MMKLFSDLMDYLKSIDIISNICYCLDLLQYISIFMIVFSFHFNIILQIYKQVSQL
jgi:hypothetical protein